MAEAAHNNEKRQIVLPPPYIKFLSDYGRKSELRRDYSIEEAKEARAVVGQALGLDPRKIAVSGIAPTAKWVLQKYNYDPQHGPMLHIEHSGEFVGVLAWLPEGVCFLPPDGLDFSPRDLHRYYEPKILPEFSHEATHHFPPELSKNLADDLRNWQNISDDRVDVIKELLQKHLGLPLFRLCFFSFLGDILVMAVFAPATETQPASQQGTLHFNPADGSCKYEPLTS
jgi:hypothetical protein